MQQNIISILRHSLAAADAAAELLESLSEAPAVHLHFDCDEEHCCAEHCSEEQNFQPSEPADEPVVKEEVQVDAATTTEQSYASYASVSVLGKVLEELNHPRFSLRTVSELCNKVGLSQRALTELLEDNDVEVVFKNRRGDGAQLIGLASRN